MQKYLQPCDLDILFFKNKDQKYQNLELTEKQTTLLHLYSE